MGAFVSLNASCGVCVPGWGALLCALTADFFKNWDAILLQIP
jgi:hypothetical protein